MDGDSSEWKLTTNKKASKKQRKKASDKPEVDIGAWEPIPFSVEYIPQKCSTIQPYMLILCGIPGSGKSTFAKSLVKAMPYKFERVNQDEMKTRKKCEEHAKSAMTRGRCIIIDRCNFNLTQRLVWYELAKAFHYDVDVVVLQPPLSLCIRRCQERTGHETVSSNDASRVVNLVNSQLAVPKKKEERSCRHFKVVRSSTEFNEALDFYLEKQP